MLRPRHDLADTRYCRRMASTGQRRDRDGREPDVTMMLPVVPHDGPSAADRTMIIPVIGWPIDSSGDVYGDHTTLLPPVYPPSDPNQPLAYGQPAWPAPPERAIGRASPVVYPPGRARVPSRPRGLPDEQPSVARSSAVMAAGSMVSRVTGLLRTVVLGAAIGASTVGNAYNIANTLPNMVYELLLGGVLSSVIVPLLMKARTQDSDRGEAYTQRLLTLATVFLGAATVIAVIAAPLLTQIVAGTSHAADKHLITTLSYLILPEIFFYGVAALLAGVLNTRGHFMAPMWSPILNNFVVILTALVFWVMPGPKTLNAATITTPQVLVLGIGTTLGIVVQASGLVPALRRVRFRWRWRFDFGRLGLGQIGRTSAWMLVYVIMTQIGLTVILKLSQGATRIDGQAPGPAIFNNAFLIFMMAHGIVAVSILTALMPRLARAAAEGRFADMGTNLSMGTRMSAVILIPVTAAYIVLGRPLAVVLFQWGQYSHREALQTGTVIAVAAIGLVPYAITQMQLFAFYAMPDTKTPALVNMPVVAVRIAVDVVLFLILPAAAIDAGLMFGNAVSYVIAAIIGYQLLRRRIGLIAIGETMSALGKLAVAAAIAAIPAWLLSALIQHELGNGKIGSGTALVVGGLVLIGAYVVVGLALKARDVAEVTSMVRRRVAPAARR
jgi:putative peptidoglycan lipid II flippase